MPLDREALQAERNRLFHEQAPGSVPRSPVDVELLLASSGDCLRGKAYYMTAPQTRLPCFGTPASPRTSERP